MTSEAMARAMQTNPVVVRRHHGRAPRRRLSPARRRAAGGGWTIARDLATITLRDIHLALGEPEFFATWQPPRLPAASVEQAVNAALDSAFRDAEALLLPSAFQRVTLAAPSADFHARMIASGRSIDRRMNMQNDAQHDARH